MSCKRCPRGLRWKLDREQFIAQFPDVAICLRRGACAGTIADIDLRPALPGYTAQHGIGTQQVRYRAATWSSRRCQIRSYLPLLFHLSGALCSEARGYRLGREEKTMEVAHLVAGTGAADEALSAMPGIDLEPFGTLSGSQSKKPGSSAHNIVG